MSETEPMPPAPKDGARATEADETAVLGELYGDPDEYGHYTGDLDDEED